MNRKLLVSAIATITSTSVTAADYTLSGSTSAGQALAANDSATVAEGAVYGGTTTNTDVDVIEVGGDDVTVTIDGLFHGGEDLILTTSAVSGLSVNIGSSGQLIATENNLGNAYDAIDLNGDSSSYVSTDATITNAGTIWVADKHAIEVTDSTGNSITNTGSISARDDTIEAVDVTNLTIINSGTISADDDSITFNAGGLDLTVAKNATTDNTAAIAFYGDSGTSNGLTLTNEVGGTITADYEAISLYGGSAGAIAQNVTITNHGTISSTKAGGGLTDGAIYAEAVNGFALTNTGTISVANRAAINLDDATGAVLINNSGVIAAGGTDGIRAADALDFGLINSGTISANSEAVRIPEAASVYINNSGTIQSTVNSAIDAIDADSAVIINSGTISSGTEVVTIGALNGDPGVQLTNTGTIKAGTTSDVAIRLANNNTVTFGEGSVVIGDIVIGDTSNPGMSTGNTLKMDVGPARSYVFSTTDNLNPWTLIDLDGRTAIEGSAIAAGVGNVETADEALFNRTNAVNNSLARYSRHSAVDSGNIWADLYTSVTRRGDSGGTAEKYSQVLTGFTAVNASADGDVQLILNFQKGDLSIADNTQKVDSTSLTVGLQNSHLIVTDKFALSGRALLTHTSYDAQQQVLDNTSSTGYRTFKGEYNSVGATLGLNATVVHEFDSAQRVEVMWDGELTHERIDAWSETSTFAWKARDLTQAVVSGRAAWIHEVNNTKYFMNLGASYRKIISGGKANYTIDATATSFDGGNQDEFSLMGGAGLEYQISQDMVAHIGVNASRSNQKTTSLAASANLEWKF